MPSLPALRAFEAVARHLSYQAAAGELHVTPAAVKQLVGRLEAALGTPLLRRHGRGLALTNAGAAGAAELQRGFEQIASAVAHMRPQSQRQSLTISVEPSFATAWLIPRLDRFKNANPDVDVLLASSLRVIAIEREAIDVAIRYGVKPARHHIVHRLFDDETLAVCSPTLAQGLTYPRRLADLERVTLLQLQLTDGEWTPTTGHWFDWRNWLAFVGASDVRPQHFLRFNDYNLAIQAAIAGQGVALGSWPLVRDAIAAGLLASPFAERARTDVGYDLVTTQPAMKRPEVAAFVEWLLAEAAAAGHR